MHGAEERVWPAETRAMFAIADNNTHQYDNALVRHLEQQARTAFSGDEVGGRTNRALQGCICERCNRLRGWTQTNVDLAMRQYQASLRHVRTTRPYDAVMVRVAAYLEAEQVAVPDSPDLWEEWPNEEEPNALI